MKTSGNTILITGGATGIGFALAKAFLKDNTVIICGRRKEKLAEAEKLGMKTVSADLSTTEGRKMLHDTVLKEYPSVNILINNAGIQKGMDLREKIDMEEIDINLKAPIELCSLFIPHLMKKDSAIFNVTSGLAFSPLSSVPIYCATKAALHSFTLSLRHQLKNTSVKVFEIIPPLIIDTELHHGREVNAPGQKTSDVVKAVLEAMPLDKYEIAVGQAEGMIQGSRANPEEMFSRMNP